MYTVSCSIISILYTYIFCTYSTWHIWHEILFTRCFPYLSWWQEMHVVSLPWPGASGAWGKVTSSWGCDCLDVYSNISLQSIELCNADIIHIYIYIYAYLITHISLFWSCYSFISLHEEDSSWQKDKTCDNKKGSTSKQLCHESKRVVECNGKGDEDGVYSEISWHNIHLVWIQSIQAHVQSTWQRLHTSTPWDKGCHYWPLHQVGSFCTQKSTADGYGMDGDSVPSWPNDTHGKMVLLECGKKTTTRPMKGIGFQDTYVVCI